MLGKRIVLLGNAAVAYDFYPVLKEDVSVTSFKGRIPRLKGCTFNSCLVICLSQPVEYDVLAGKVIQCALKFQDCLTVGSPVVALDSPAEFICGPSANG